MELGAASLNLCTGVAGHGYRTALVGNPMALGSSFYSDDVGFDEHCIRALTLADVPAGATFTGQFEGKYNFPNAKPFLHDIGIRV